MRVHHINCISTCPIGGKLMDGESARAIRGHLACHCLLVEAGDQLVLVDTGFGLRDVHDPYSRLSRFFMALLSPRFREDMTAIRSIQRLGFDPRDVRHIVLTHLDFDHAGGLDDFPWATVHLMADEREAAFAQRTLLDRMRYRPQQWSTRNSWRVYASDSGEPWYGFDAVRDLVGLPPDLLMVPLVGHTLGHAGVAVRTGPGWKLLAGDAYFWHAELHPTRPRCTPGLKLYQWMMDKDRPCRLWNQRRLRELRRDHADEVLVFSSHDPREFEWLARRALMEPVPPVRTLRPRPPSFEPTPQWV